MCFAKIIKPYFLQAAGNQGRLKQESKKKGKTCEDLPSEKMHLFFTRRLRIISSSSCDDFCEGAFCVCVSQSYVSYVFFRRA